MRIVPDFRRNLLVCLRAFMRGSMVARLTFFALLAIGTGRLQAQSLEGYGRGFSGEPFFASEADYVITALTAEANGRLFYFESDGVFNGQLPARIWSRQIGPGGAGAATLLHDLGVNVAASFLTFSGGRLYIGDSSGAIYSLSPAGNNLDPLGNVPLHYDGDLHGDSLYLSHRVSGENKVTKFELIPDGNGGQMLGEGDVILDAGNEFSGPVKLNASGSFFYGSTAPSGGVYQYSSRDVAGAFGPSALTLNDAHRLAATPANAYFAAESAEALWHVDSSSLSRIDIATATAESVATSSDVIGNLEYRNSKLFVVVTDFVGKRSVVHAVVPEPGVVALLAMATLLVGRRTRLSARRGRESAARGCRMTG